MYEWLGHFAVQQKLAEYCKIDYNLKKEKNKWTNEWVLHSNESYILASQHLTHSEQHLHLDVSMLVYMLSLLIRIPLKQLKNSYLSFSSAQTSCAVEILSFLLQDELAPFSSSISLDEQVTSCCDTLPMSVFPTRKIKGLSKDRINYLIYILVPSTWHTVGPRS